MDREILDGDAYRREVRRLLESDTDGLVGFMLDGLLKEIPAYQGAWGDAAEIRAAVRRSAELVVRSMFDGPADAADRAAWHLIGAQRARQGIEREELALGLDVAVKYGWDWLLQRLATVPAPGPVAATVLLDLWRSLGDASQAAREALLAGHKEERSLELSNAALPHAGLVARLLDTMWNSPDEMRRTAAGQGVDLGVPMGLLIVTRFQGDGRDLDKPSGDLAGAVKGAVVGPTRTLPMRHVPLLVPASTPRKWAEARRRAHAVAVQNTVVVLALDPVDPLGPLETVYRHILRKAHVVPAATTSPGLVGADDIEYHWLLATAPLEDQADFVRRVLGPIFATGKKKAAEQLALLDALYETREGIVGAARELGIHRNTADLRKKRIAEVTGFSLDVTAEAHRLLTAARLRWVIGPVLIPGSVLP